MKFVREQFFLAATAQNLKRVVRSLSLRPFESALVPIQDGERKRNASLQEITPAQKFLARAEFYNTHGHYHYLNRTPPEKCAVDELHGNL
jgi:hypothetical protein